VEPGPSDAVEKPWEQVAVGDILVVRDGEEFPADLVPLYCSGDEGTCYVSTANLDGETNLKLKSAPAATQKILDQAGICVNDLVKPKFRRQSSSLDEAPARKGNLLTSLSALGVGARVEAEVPQASIHDFTGRLELATGQEEPLGSKQLLLRGTVLRNTDFCVGVVVYTGSETRMVLNTRQATWKQSNLERVTNVVMLVVLAAIGILALLSDVVFNINKSTFHHLWYLIPPDLILPDWLSYWLTFCVLYSNMMPISLYPTMEFCNSMQAYFIKNDVNMYWNELEFPASVQSSNLCQELGQVNYIFSDKTGTLTQNVMELKRIWIAGRMYGKVTEEKGFCGGEELRTARGEGQGRDIDLFLEVLAVAHTAVVSAPTNGGPPGYEAESPDESALVEAVAQLGWRFASRVGERMVVAQEVGASKEIEYQILAVNAFDSARKRMSVVVQKGGEFFLFAKGADNVMLDRSSVASKNLGANLDEALTNFAGEGLRTLVIGRRTLRQDECRRWLDKYQAAQKSLEDRDGNLARVAEEIEVDLDIVGVTAIEDKLQTGVPETIEKLREAGINLWVLTGDKLETARNIGFSAKVLEAGMTIATLDRAPDSTAASVANAVDAEAARLSSLESLEKAMMVTGAALEVILGDMQLKMRFLAVAQNCSVVIACRVSPLQKAQMVRLVREGVKPTPVTLSVGDGANDVPMIQEAQVGVGIAGREGRQAVNNSDFAIGQFSYLQRLLLVHGRWNYRRACKFTLFTFWRNAVQVLLIFYYTFLSGYSGTSIFEDWIRLSFNFLCSFPIMATGCFDQDVTDRVALAYPKLYTIGRCGMDLNTVKICQALASAVVHSLTLWGITCMAYPSMELLGVSDYYSWGTAVYTCLMLDMNYRVLFLNSTHNRYTLGSIMVSSALYVFYLVVYPCTRLFADLLGPNMYMVPYQLATSVPFWLSLLTVLTVMVNLDLFLMMVGAWRQTQNGDLAKAKKICAGPSGSWRSPYELLLVPPDPKADQELEEPQTIDTSSFAQQKHRGLYYDGSHFTVRLCSFLAALLLIGLGYLALSSSKEAAQVRIHYEGEGIHVDPLGTYDEEVVHAQPNCSGIRTCTIQVKVPRTMTPPILVYYAAGPFYQNYNDYMKSEVAKELMAKPAPEKLRETLCSKSTRIDSDGNQIVPCGLKVMSMFNDTFSVSGLAIDKKNVAWASDVERYRNPEDYLKRPGTVWLHDLYPGIVSQDEGVKNEQFVTWMRPAALRRVVKHYGWIQEKLEAGRVLKLSIQSRYPVREFDGYKHLIITELGPFGGRHHGFGYTLMFAGAVCMLLGAAVTVMVRYQDSTAQVQAYSDQAKDPLI